MNCFPKLLVFDILEYCRVELMGENSLTVVLGQPHTGDFFDWNLACSKRSDIAFSTGILFEQIKEKCFHLVALR